MMRCRPLSRRYLDKEYLDRRLDLFGRAAYMATGCVELALSACIAVESEKVLAEATCF